MNIRKKILLYLYFAATTVRGEMAYRVSFLTGVVGQWLSYGATYFALYVTVGTFDNLAGWTAPEVLFMYAFNLLSYALGAAVFFNPATQLANRIRTGEFDSALVKPVNPLIHEIYMGFNFGYIGHIILSVCIMVVFSKSAGFVPNSVNILFFFIMLFGATLIQASFLLLSSVASFFLIGQNPFTDFLLWKMKSFTNYPIHIYGVAIQIVLTFILPFAFINYYPVSVILGKPNLTHFPDVLQYMTPIVAIILFLLSVKVWFWGLSKYQSTGS